MNHLPKMTRGRYDEQANKFNLELTPITLLDRNDARRVLRRDACTICNYTNNVRRVTFYVRTSAESADDSTTMAVIDLKAYETVSIPEWTIKSGWILEADADANSAVNVLLSWDEEVTK